MSMKHLPLPNKLCWRRLSGQLRRASHHSLTVTKVVLHLDLLLDATAQFGAVEILDASSQDSGVDGSCEPTRAQSNALLERRKRFV